jgi:hypothetical protein
VASKKKCKVFVSYSRHDEALVRPLAGLLGVAADDAVFLDVTSLKPGDLWEEEIFDALKEASVFILCWCCESEKSKNVAKEIKAALSDHRKKLVPVLFCGAPLPPDLAERQWTDLRGKVVHNCSEHPKGKSPLNLKLKRDVIGADKAARVREAALKEARERRMQHESRKTEQLRVEKGSLKPQARLQAPTDAFRNAATQDSRYPMRPANASTLSWSDRARLVGIAAVLFLVVTVLFHFFGGKALLRIGGAAAISGLIAILAFRWTFRKSRSSPSSPPRPKNVGQDPCNRPLSLSNPSVGSRLPATPPETEADFIADRAKNYFEGLAKK